MTDFKNNSRISDAAAAKSLEELVQGVLDILEADDGASFEEKRKKAIEYLERTEGEISAVLIKKAEAEIKGEKIKADFWGCGDGFSDDGSLFIRKVCEEDREHFLEVKRNYFFAKYMLEREATRQMLWDEHNEPHALMCSVFRDGEYIGYCGIGDISQQPWEISVELLPQWTGRGMGYRALRLMLSSIKSKLGIEEFRVRIDPGNYASQALFEKLGAVPNGISEYFLHGEQLREHEDSNLHLIDDRLTELAEKFNVSPRRLLSHVLEYRLLWK